jgi:hypothetical protein
MDDKFNSVPVEYDCAECGEISATPFVYEETPSDHTKHSEYVDTCFACKVRTLELNTGDAGRADAKMSQKKWDKELYAYEDARKQGIQPAGTSMAQIQAAYQASDTLGAAYNADVMPATDKITKSSAEGLKATGDI